MKAEIIAVGTELLLGDILNTNAQFLSQELAAMGITVLHQHVIGDNAGRLKELVEMAKGRSELLIFSGGLGPTADDLTKETVAACYHDTLRFDEEEWAKITGFFARMGRETTPNNRKQAMVPVRGRKLPNQNGTAPGVWFEDEGRIAILLPGPPGELRPLWKNVAAPMLAAWQNCVLHSVVLRVCGPGESEVEAKVGHLFEHENPTAAIYAKTGEVIIRITARAPTDAEAEAACRDYAKNFYELLGDAVYDEDVEGMEETLVRILRQKGLAITTAESCTGGLVSQRITAVPGASEVFRFGFVTYANEAKQRLLGVEARVLEKYGAVSSQTAAAMAFGALNAAGADLALALTGIAGPGGGTPQKPVGLVYIAAAHGDTVWIKKLMLAGRSRETVRLRASQQALDMARRLALGLLIPGARMFLRGENAEL